MLGADPSEENSSGDDADDWLVAELEDMIENPPPELAFPQVLGSDDIHL